MRLTLLLLVLSAGLSAAPAFAQGTPPNPFASNYPSAPPTLEQMERARARQARPRAPRNSERGLVPPAPIPNR